MYVILVYLKKALRKILDRRSVLIIIILVLTTFLIGTYGFKHFENQKIDQDYEDALADYRQQVRNDPENATQYEEPGSPEHYDTFTTFYWTVVTVTTVGYGDFSPVSEGGRIIFFVVAGLGISMISLILGEFASFLVEMKLMSLRGLSKSKLKGHVVIIGWNSITKATHTELKARHVDAVIIDNEVDPMVLKAEGVLFVAGDPNQREVLERAKVNDASTLLIPQAPDAESLMISTKARLLNPEIRIITTCDDIENRQTLINAGVKTVIPSSDVQGQMLANAIDEEKVVEFVLDVMQEDTGLDIDEYWPKERTTVGQIPVDKDQKIIVVYLGGRPELNFNTKTVLNPGDWALILERARAMEEKHVANK